MVLHNYPSVGSPGVKNWFVPRGNVGSGVRRTDCRIRDRPMRVRRNDSEKFSQDHTTTENWVSLFRGKICSAVIGT
jgi:hypothetical protein